MNREIIAVIPAAGVGSRMQANKPKQYLKILDKTILEHTLSSHSIPPCNQSRYSCSRKK